MKIFQTPSYDRFCLFEMERKSKDFRGMDGNAAYKNKQIMQGKIVEAIIKEIFSQDAPTRCIQARMRCPPVESKLENE